MLKKILYVLACVIWILLGGIWMALIWAALGLLLCLTVIGIPFGMQCFKLAVFSFLPVGKKVDTNFGMHPVANALWLIFVGWDMAIIYLLVGIANCLMILGIPTGVRCFRIMKLALFPFGANIKKSVK